MNLEKIGQIWKEKLPKKIVTEMSFMMNIQKRRAEAVVETVSTVPHLIKNQAVISTGNCYHTYII